MLVSDPTQIRGGVLALTAEQQSAAIYAYSKNPIPLQNITALPILRLQIQVDKRKRILTFF